MSRLAIPDVEGRWVLIASWSATALFTVTAVIGAIFYGWTRVPAAIVARGLFLVGIVIFLASFWRAIGRSREETVAVSTLFFLAGSPREVQLHLLGSLGVQVVVAVVTASMRLYTSLALGILVPIIGIGFSGMWAARYAAFPPRAS